MRAWVDRSEVCIWLTQSLLLACIKVRLPLCLLTVESRLQTQEPFFKLENLQIDDMFWRINVFEWFIVFLLICPLSLACMTVGGPTLLLRRAPLLQCNCTAGSVTFSSKQIKKVIAFLLIHCQLSNIYLKLASLHDIWLYILYIGTTSRSPFLSHINVSTRSSCMTYGCLFWIMHTVSLVKCIHIFPFSCFLLQRFYGLTIDRINRQRTTVRNPDWKV